MKTRIITAAILVPILLLLTLVVPQTITAIALGLLLAIAAYELLYRTGLLLNPQLVIYSAAMAFAVSMWSRFGAVRAYLLLLLLVFSVLLFTQMMRDHIKIHFEMLAMCYVAGFVIPYMLSALMRILTLATIGRNVILIPFLVAFLSDTGAYFIGMRFGKHKLAPVVSPNKTVEGLLGGIAFAGIFPAINAVLTQSTDPSDRGKVFGYSYATQQFGSVIGPVLGGALATYYSNQLALIISGGLLLPLVAVLYLYRPKQKQLATGAPLDVVTAVRNAMLAKRQQQIRQTVEESYGDEPHELDLSASATTTKEPAHMQHVRDAVEESYGESESGSPKSPSECR